MRHAIGIKSINQTSHPIRNFWETISRFETSPSMQQLNYPPHFTLAIYEDINQRLLAEAARRIAITYSVLEINFTEVTTFETAPNVLWLKAKEEDVLEAMRRVVHEIIPEDKCDYHYRLENWQPHCTLATNLATEHHHTAMEFAQQNFAPFRVRFDTIDWIRFPPVSILGEARLSQAR